MNFSTYPHQYVERGSQQVVTERPIGDRCIHFLYNTLRESVPAMFQALTSKRMSSLLGFCHYDMVGQKKGQATELFQRVGADWQECTQPLSFYDSYRKVFERQIRYWHTRPMAEDDAAVVSPADSRVLIGSFDQNSLLSIKGSFFDLPELIGKDSPWLPRFSGGDFAVFRLTPDKYHYNHVPVSGRVVNLYWLDGGYHSCNPSATVSMASLYSKNRRMVTLIDTDVQGGTHVGMVAMVEVVALMIGDIQQAYSLEQYANPQELRPGKFVQKGCPKSLFKPGSSTDVLVFEPRKILFSEDLIRNSRRNDVQSRFTGNWGVPLVETDILVRSTIAEAVSRSTTKH